MKQIRPRIFETNSSTTHSLTIARNVVTPEIIEKFKKENGTHIVFGKNDYETMRKKMFEDPSIDENTDFQIKADILYLSMYMWSNESICEFLMERNKLQKKLEDLGFTVEFREDQEILDDFEYHRYDVNEDLFLEMFCNINEIIDYLFYNHVLYYTWCDECMSECPKKISEAEDRFHDYGKTEELHTHFYR